MLLFIEGVSKGGIFFPLGKEMLNKLPSLADEDTKLRRRLSIGWGQAAVNFDIFHDVFDIVLRFFN